MAAGRKKQRERDRSKAQFQREVLALAGGVCENPGCSELQMDFKTKVKGHHIILSSQGGADKPENGIALCIRCHYIAHNGLGLHGISAHVFMVNLLTLLVNRSWIAFARWSDTLEMIKAKWNL